MKILSTIINGGKYTKVLLSIIIASMFILSCDTAILIPFENKENIININTESGNVQIVCRYFNGLYSLGFELKGEYCLNPDSLNIILNDDSLCLHKYYPSNELKTFTKNNTLVKDTYLWVGFGYETKDNFKPIIEYPTLSILPSSFLTSNDKRIIKDTLSVRLTQRKLYYQRAKLRK